MLVFWIIFCVVVVMGIFMLLIFAPDFVFPSATGAGDAPMGHDTASPSGLEAYPFRQRASMDATSQAGLDFTGSATH